MRPGYIPFEPFLTVIKRELGFIKNNGHGAEIGLYSKIGTYCNLRQDSIEKSFKRGFRSGEIDFDLADLIICRVGGPLLWQHPELKKIYEDLRLPEEKEIEMGRICV